MHNWTQTQKIKASASMTDSGQWSVVETQQAVQTPGRNKFKGLVIVVDDQSTGRKILTELLQQMSIPLQVRCFSDPLEALQFAHNETPDLVLTDYKMPSMDGVEFTNQIRSIKECVDVPLVVFTVCEDRTIRYKALEAGATDFITRPIDQHECQARFKNLLTMRKQQLIIKNRADWLADQVAVATKQVRSRERETLIRLARVGEYRLEHSGMHVMRIAYFSRMLAEGLGMHETDCHEIELAAPLHDIGKVGIPDHILQKPTRLNDDEYELMKQHPRLGYDILKGSPSNFMQLGAIIALNHHEKFDGSGYPQGLFGDEIPLAGRIVAITDVFDALCSDRPYRNAWKFDQSISYIKKQAGKHFDPELVKIFISCEEKIKITQNEFKSPP